MQCAGYYTHVSCTYLDLFYLVLSCDDLSHNSSCEQSSVFFDRISFQGKKNSDLSLQGKKQNSLTLILASKEKIITLSLQGKNTP